MTLTETELTINLGDSVTFIAQNADDKYRLFVGKVSNVLQGNELTLLVNVNEFYIAQLTIDNIKRVNNVIIASPQFKEQYTVRVGV